MPVEEITTYQLPYNVVEASTGFSFDMGGSVLKVVYRHKDDWATAQKEKSSQAPVRLVCYPRHELDDAMKLLKENCHISEGDKESKPVVYATGVGSQQYGPKVEKELNVRIQVLTEFDCFVKAFVYMAQYVPKKNLFHPESENAKKRIAHNNEAIKKQFAAFFKKDEDGEKMTEMKLNEDFMKQLMDGKHDLNENTEKVAGKEDCPYAESVEVFPCLLAMLGSGFAWMKIEKDGSFALVDGSNCGGRFFYGLGTILTGCQDYEELISMAEKGNCKNVDIFTSDLAKEAAHVRESQGVESTTKTMYDSMDVADELVYCFGKGVRSKPGDFKKEDLAASLLQVMCLNTTQALLSSAEIDGIKNIYFCGSFTNSEFTRDGLLEKLHLRKNQFAILKPDSVISNPTIEFVKGGGHLGALGAFVYEKKQKNDEDTKL